VVRSFSTTSGRKKRRGKAPGKLCSDSATRPLLPAGMTLGFRTAGVKQYDREIAKVLYAEEKKKYTGPELAQFHLEKVIDDFDAFYNYTMHMNNFIAKMVDLAERQERLSRKSRIVWNDVSYGKATLFFVAVTMLVARSYRKPSIQPFYTSTKLVRRRPPTSVYH